MRVILRWILIFAAVIALAVFLSKQFPNAPIYVSNPFLVFCEFVVIVVAYILVVSAIGARRCKDYPEEGKEIDKDIKEAQDFYRSKNVTF
ncbi:hypothetical protein BLNAU_23176 [Blattamonas nauphoetae]|uniref:Dolichol-phosphate mannosyltransferase subunit 3 n=1 Tax=Blattamonas nauphoetae TaxID=2049346 RepID=A0ABQ9WQZ1_9EUKA|nr:hypothetical protein BLNAU_23176 [Blattamonas nauphoetae]